MAKREKEKAPVVEEQEVVEVDPLIYRAILLTDPQPDQGVVASSS